MTSTIRRAINAANEDGVSSVLSKAKSRIHTEASCRIWGKYQLEVQETMVEFLAPDTWLVDKNKKKI